MELPDDLVIRPNQADVKRLFDFLEFRTFEARLAEALGPAAAVVASADRSELHPELRMSESPGESAAALAGSEAVSLAAAYDGEPGRLTGRRAGRRDGSETADVLWIPAEHLTDDEVAAALRTVRFRGHDTKSLMRSLLAQGIEPVGLELDTAIAAYLLRPAEARYELGHLLEDYTTYAAPSDDPTASGQLDLGGTEVSAEVRAARGALAVAASSTRSRRTSPSRGWPSCTRRSRTRSSSSSPGWSTSASPSTGPPRAALPEAHRRRRPARRRPADDLRSRRSQRQLDDPAAPDPVHRAWPDAGQEDEDGASTDASSLEKLQEQWPGVHRPVAAVPRGREAARTYGEGLLLEVAADGRIHATFNQTVARTGRLSSDRPNLHNIPVRRDEGRQFRRVFVPAPGYVMLVADYNQIELRCIAHLAADPGLIAAFTSEQDIHNATAARSSASTLAPSPSTSARRRRWSPTAWPTGWRRTGSANASTSRRKRRR